MDILELPTPSLLLDRARMQANIDAMHARLASLGVPLRPHFKTAKCLPVIQEMLRGQPGGVAVSTLAEARFLFSHGITDILYAVAVAPAKLDGVAALQKQGAAITLVLDNMAAARAVADYGRENGCVFAVLLEIDSDGHRSGLPPESAAIVEIGRVLHQSPGTELRGVMTHAGGSYDCRSTDCIRAVADKERNAVVAAARALRLADLPCKVVSVGSTPTATFASDLAGVTEVRAGVYAFMDLVMAGLGVCRLTDIALSCLSTVIGHQVAKNWIVTDGGWMALSRDRGTANQAVDQSFGLVCDIEGNVLEDLIVVSTNQEHGIVAHRHGGPLVPERFPLGTRLRILPNHACAIGGQHACYQVVEGKAQEIIATWPRHNGW